MISATEICPICTSAQVTPCFFALPKSGHQNRLPLLICQECGHARRLDSGDFSTNLQMQHTSFEAHAKSPDKRSIRWPRRPALVASEIRRLAGNQGKALDVGCGLGLGLAALGNTWEKYGVELSEKRAAIARTFANATIYCGPIESYEPDVNSFDLITAFALIEHLNEPRSFVEWAYRHLKSGGLLVLMTGDRESKTALEMAENWPLYHCDKHTCFFSQRSLTRLVEDAGFCIVRKEWRFMYTSCGMGNAFYRHSMKLKEILRFVTKPRDDHFYLYAKKPVDRPKTSGD
jgi:SAM-dependent methyltransferase